MKSGREFFLDYFKENDLVSAPLAGITTPVFRRVMRKYFNGLQYSEMASVEGISRRSEDSLEYLKKYPNEKGVVFQLFGGKPSTYVEAIKVAEELYDIEAYDINMGCPVKKVIKAGSGVALLEDLPRMRDIITAVRKSTSKPFSVKTRIGLDDKRLMYKEVLKIAEGEGVDALTIHARTKKDMFSGRVRHDILAEMKSLSPKMIIIGNGGVTDYESYLAMKESGVEAVMVGRAMMRAPWVMKAIREKLAVDFISKREILELLLTFERYMVEDADGRENKLTHYKHIIMKFAVWFSKGMHSASDFRVDIYSSKSYNEVIDKIINYYSTYDEDKPLISI